MPSDEELVAEATAQLRSLVAEEERLQKTRLDEARKKGGQNTWGRMSVPEDKRIKEEDDTALPSVKEAEDPSPAQSNRHTSDTSHSSRSTLSDEPPPLIH